MAASNDRFSELSAAISSIREALLQTSEAERTRSLREIREKWRFRVELGTLVALVVAALVAFGGIVVTHRDTLKALREAHATAEQQHADTLAAIGKAQQNIEQLKSQADIMHEQLVANSRAFVYLHSFNTSFQEDGRRFVIGPVWGNSGNTPTLHLTTKVWCSNLVGLNTTVDFGEVLTHSTMTRFVIGPKATEPASSCRFDRDIIERINSGDFCFYIGGEADYNDAVTKTKQRRTQFFIQIVRVNPSNINDIVGASSGSHDCADDECPKLKRVMAQLGSGLSQ